jgi:hypothetical protein
MLSGQRTYVEGNASFGGGAFSSTKSGIIARQSGEGLIRSITDTGLEVLISSQQEISRWGYSIQS